MMKRSRKELKALAKRALLGNYGTVVGSLLLGYLALFVLAAMIAIFLVVGVLSGGLDSDPGIGAAAGFVAGIVVLYLLILSLGMLFMLGITRICFQFCIGQAGKLGDVLYAFRNHPLRFAGLSLLLMFLILLGSVPGIVLMLAGQLMVQGAAGAALYVIGYVVTFFLGIAAALRFSLSVFVLLEEPWRKAGECIRLSREMMEGNMMRLFKLQASFFGILLLSYLTFGIGTLWTMPYMVSTNICFYLSVKEEKYGLAPAGHEAGRPEETDPWGNPA